MKILWVLILLIVSNSATASISSNLVGKVLNNFADEQKKKNNLSTFGMGSSIPDDIRGFSITLLSEKPMELQQARKLYIELAENLLARINSNKEIRPYLHNYPATIDNLSLLLGFPKGKEPNNKQISLILTAHRVIDYCVWDPVAGKHMDDYEEPYEEALKIVKGETSPKLATLPTFENGLSAPPN